MKMNVKLHPSAALSLETIPEYRWIRFGLESHPGRYPCREVSPNLLMLQVAALLE
jgi:hypothetical protein